MQICFEGALLPVDLVALGLGVYDILIGQLVDGVVLALFAAAGSALAVVYLRRWFSRGSA